MTALVTYQDQVCELLGMVRGFGGRLFFALREPDGTVVCASGRDIELFNATIYSFPQRPDPVAVPPTASLRMPSPVSLSPAGGGANSNYGDV